MKTFSVHIIIFVPFPKCSTSTPRKLSAIEVFVVGGVWSTNLCQCHGNHTSSFLKPRPHYNTNFKDMRPQRAFWKSLVFGVCVSEGLNRGIIMRHNALIICIIINVPELVWMQSKRVMSVPENTHTDTKIQTHTLS